MDGLMELTNAGPTPESFLTVILSVKVWNCVKTLNSEGIKFNVLIIKFPNAHINVNHVGGGGAGQYRGFDDKTHPLPGTFSNLPVPRLSLLMRMSSDA
jgi:hypothetical protein